jgi:hypothetical protein
MAPAAPLKPVFGLSGIIPRIISRRGATSGMADGLLKIQKRIPQRYRLLGNSGLRVSEASLGTMTFGEDWRWGTAKDASRKVYDAFRR